MVAAEWKEPRMREINRVGASNRNELTLKNVWALNCPRCKVNN